jgi:ABC-type polysaccharide/polyol phosphate export permease
MLNPLGMMLVLSMVFSHLFGSLRAYPIYVLTGLVLWRFFAQATHSAMSTLLWGGSLLRQVYMPPTSFALSSTGSELVNLMVSLVPLIAVMLVMSVPVCAAMPFVVVPMLLAVCFALGVGLLLSSVAAFFYDVAEFYEILLTAWFYLTPILYPEDMLPPSVLAWIRALNPMYHLVSLYRLPLYEGRMPGVVDILPAAAWSLGCLLLGWLAFTWKSQHIANRI